MRLIYRAGFFSFLILSLCIFAAAQSGKYTIQLEAAPTQADAEERVKQLKAKDVEAYVLKSQVPGKGTFFRVRAGMFANQNEARKYGALLQQKGVIRDYFVAPFEQTKEELAANGNSDRGGKGGKSAAKPPATSGADGAGNAKTAAVVPAAPPAGNENARGAEAPKGSNVSSTPTVKAPSAALPAGANFTQFKEPQSGFSFDYPSYWNGAALSADEAKAQRINAGAQFQSPEDHVFLQAIWNELAKANSPTNDNDLIVDVIIKSMRTSDGTRVMDELSRKVVEDKEKGQIKTYIDLRATFQQDQTEPLPFIGKAVIIRTGRGILLVATFYSKNSRPEVAAVADKVIASVKAPE